MRPQAGDLMLPAAVDTPRVATLTTTMVGAPADALFGPVERVPLEEAAGPVAAEIVAPAPPGVPRLVPGRQIGAEHVAWLAANRDMGMSLLDPTAPSQRTVRCVAEDASPPE